MPTISREEKELLYSEQDERILIGQLLLNHENFFLENHEGLTPEDFYNTFYRQAYEAVLAEYSESFSTDFSAVATRLGRNISELADIVDKAFIYRALSNPLQRVKALAQKRKVRDQLFLAQKKLGTTDDLSDVLSDLQDIVVGSVREKGAVYEGHQIADFAFEKLEQYLQCPGGVQGLRTGFSAIDTDIGGFVGERLTLLSGFSGTGKTSLALNWLAEIGIRQGVPCLFLSLEMSPQDVAERLLAIVSEAPMKDIHRGRIDDRIQRGLDKISQGALIISDNKPRNIFEASAVIEKYAMTKGIQFFALDYIGELVQDGRKDEQRDERYARWVKSLRDICKRHSMHGLVLCQVNQAGELAESKKMSHLADAWMHFERERDRYFLEMRKNRFGPPAKRYKVLFTKYNQRMEEVGVIDEQE